MSKGLIVFVHGLGGCPQKTWQNFRSLCREDATLKEYQLYCFGYPTSLLRLPFAPKYPSIQILSEALRTEITNRFPNETKIILVGHSLGGLIVRKYLLEELKCGKEHRLAGAILYAVPNTGAHLAAIANEISWRHHQLRQLCKESDIIDYLNKDWISYKVENRIAIKYVVAGQDSIVDEASARLDSKSNKISYLANKNHRTIVHPDSKDDSSFLIFKNFVKSIDFNPDLYIQKYETGLPLSCPIKSGRYKLIAFDLDGTLIQGPNFEYSWRAIWDFLDIDPKIARSNLSEFSCKYVKKQLSFEDYKEWCRRDLRKMTAHNLKRDDFTEIVKDLYPTKNLVTTLTSLRNHGFILALISGGVDTFVDMLIPQAKSLFDYICINRLHFNDQGFVCEIEPTPFDFDGKATALEAICKIHNIDLKETVFVGEGFNDQDAGAAAGLSIAYPATQQAFAVPASVEIEEDDLRAILKYVLL